MDNFGDAPGQCWVDALFVEGRCQRVATRLVRLRAEWPNSGLMGYYGREDMFQGEEVPPGDERLAYISGFTGSLASP